jgi:hypothetical protein
MDYAHRHRIKIWGRAKAVEDAETIAKLMPEGYAARPEQAILFTVEAWEGNCHQHIPQKFDAADVAATLTKLQARIDELEAENTSLPGMAVPADRPVYGAASLQDNNLAAGEGEADTSPTDSIG